MYDRIKRIVFILFFCSVIFQMLDKAKGTINNIDTKTNLTPVVVVPPFKLRDQVIINVMDAYPFNDINATIASLDNKKLWRRIRVSDSVMKSTSWKFSKDTHCVFYRFIIDSNHKLPERLHLIIGQSAFETTVYVDGKERAKFTEGFMPLELDVTDAVSVPGQHEVLIMVKDHYACRGARGNPLVPLGAMFKYTKGIIMPPKLVALNKTLLKTPFIRSDINKGKVYASVDISSIEKNIGKFSLEFSILDSLNNRQVISVKKNIDIGNKQEELFTLDVGDKLKLWDIAQPNLYIGEFKIFKDRKLIDCISVKFGYRTVSVSGENIFLNGRKIRLLGPWGHIGEWTWAPRKLKTDKTYEGLFRLLLKRGMNYGRLHAQVYNKKFYDAADATGFLLVAESSLAHRPKTEASLIHLENMVKYLRNHPSIIIWSGSNEFEHWKVPRPEKTMKFLLKCQDIIKENDGTRPVMHSGFGDAFGKLDIYNIHYPDSKYREYPLSFYWKNHPERLGHFYRTNYERYNPVGKKPIAIGEQLIPKGKFPLESVYGEKALRYRLDGSVKSQLKNEVLLAEFWTEAIRAYREQNIAMISPNLFYLPDAVDSVFLRGIAQEGWGFGAYIKEWFPAIKQGINKRTLYLFEDRGFNFKGNLDVKIKLGDEEIYSLQENVSLKPNEFIQKKIEFSVPSHFQNIDGEIDVSLSCSGKTNIYHSSRFIKYYHVANPPHIKEKILLVGVGKEIEEYFNTFCDNISVQDNFKDIGLFRVVVIGSACSLGNIQSATKELGSFMECGGSVFFMSRDKFPESLPQEIKLRKSIASGATCGFIRAPHHFIFKKAFYNINNDDLRFWGENYRISKHNMYKPDTGNGGRILIDCSTDLADALLLEFPYVKGGYICSQLNLQNPQDEPAVAELLYNIVQYSATVKSKFVKSGGVYLDGIESYTEYLLKNIGFNKYSGGKYDKDFCLFLDDSSIIATDNNKLSQLIKNAESIYIHGVSKVSLNKLQLICGTVLQGVAGIDKKIVKGIYINSVNPVLDSISSIDLNFTQGKNKSRLLKFSDGHDWVIPITPALLAIRNINGKKIILDNIAWNQEVDYPDRRLRFLSGIFANLGVFSSGRKMRKFSNNGEYITVNIKPYCNTSIRRFLGVKAPVGRMTVRGVPVLFLRESATSSNTMLRLSGHINVLDKSREFEYDTPIDNFQVKTPETVRIKCNKIQAAEIYFAHSATRNWKIPLKKRRVGQYRINYANGTSQNIDLYLGSNIFDSRRVFGDVKNCFMAFSFPNTANGDGETGTIGILSWKNPFPERKIDSIDIVSGNNPTSDIMLFGITYQKTEEEYY